MNPTILVIDDEFEMAQLLKIELESEGYDVILSHDGRSGLEKTQEIKPDLLILDVMLPDLSGYEILDALKKDSKTKEIPVIMLTAKGLEDDVQKGLDIGADDYVSKPFHSGLLLKRIKTILKKV